MLTRRALLTGGVLTGTVAGVGELPEFGVDRFSVFTRKQRQQRRAGGQGPGGYPGHPDGRQRRQLSRTRRDPQAAEGFPEEPRQFPDFIEVGIDVWESVMNWHVRTRQRAEVQRTADGRYSIAVFQTNLVLRYDVSNNYIGTPYDRK